MTQMRNCTAAIAVVLSVLMIAASANAGSSTYDLTPMLGERHPFAGKPYNTTVERPRSQFQASAQAQISTSAPYSPAIPRSAPVPKQPTEDTLVSLLGLKKASHSPPSSSQAGTALPQVAADGAPAAKSGDPSFITVGGGWFDFNDNEQAAEFRLEWRSSKMFWIFKPFAGAMATSDAAIYGYGGFLTDFFFGRRIVVTPSFAAGLYEDGDGKDLGSVIEFRSGLELGWRFDNRSRLSAMVYHISNASIDDNNPGTEVFSVGYSFPLQ